MMDSKAISKKVRPETSNPKNNSAGQNVHPVVTKGTKRSHATFARAHDLYDDDEDDDDDQYDDDAQIEDEEDEDDDVSVAADYDQPMMYDDADDDEEEEYVSRKPELFLESRFLPPDAVVSRTNQNGVLIINPQHAGTNGTSGAVVGPNQKVKILVTKQVTLSAKNPPPKKQRSTTTTTRPPPPPPSLQLSTANGETIIRRSQFSDEEKLMIVRDLFNMDDPRRDQLKHKPLKVIMRKYSVFGRILKKKALTAMSAKYKKHLADNNGRENLDQQPLVDKRKFANGRKPSICLSMQEIFKQIIRDDILLGCDVGATLLRRRLQARLDEELARSNEHLNCCKVVVVKDMAERLMAVVISELQGTGGAADPRKQLADSLRAKNQMSSRTQPLVTPAGLKIGVNASQRSVCLSLSHALRDQLNHGEERKNGGALNASVNLVRELIQKKLRECKARDEHVHCCVEPDNYTWKMAYDMRRRWKEAANPELAAASQAAAAAIQAKRSERLRGNRPKTRKPSSSTVGAGQSLVVGAKAFTSTACHKVLTDTVIDAESCHMALKNFLADYAEDHTVAVKKTVAELPSEFRRTLSVKFLQALGKLDKVGTPILLQDPKQLDANAAVQAVLDAEAAAVEPSKLTIELVYNLLTQWQQTSKSMVECANRCKVMSNFVAIVGLQHVKAIVRYLCRAVRVD